MIVHRSNRIEELVDALAELVADAAGRSIRAGVRSSCRAAAWSAGWRMELARRLGVWANPALSVSAQSDRRGGAAVLGDAAPPDRRSSTRTRCAGRSPRRCRATSSPRVRADPPLPGRRRARRAALPARRPHRRPVRPVRGLPPAAGARLGTRRRSVDWQAGALARPGRAPRCRSTPRRARARCWRRCAAGRHRGADSRGALSLFGLSTLPPLYVQILAALGAQRRAAPVRAQPVARVLGRRALASRHDPSAGAARCRRAERSRRVCREHRRCRAEGHPLLASLGRVGRDFQQVLEELRRLPGRPCDRYVDPGRGLAARRAAVRHLLDLRVARRRGVERRRAGCAAAGDDSIAVHACHGADARGRGAARPAAGALRPRSDAARRTTSSCMTPAIDTYAPLIEAVFDSGGRPPHSVPHRRPPRPRTQHEVVDAFLRALELLARPPAGAGGARPARAASRCARASAIARRGARARAPLGGGGRHPLGRRRRAPRRERPAGVRREYLALRTRPAAARVRAARSTETRAVRRRAAVRRRRGRRRRSCSAAWRSSSRPLDPLPRAPCGDAAHPARQWREAARRRCSPALVHSSPATAYQHQALARRWTSWPPARARRRASPARSTSAPCARLLEDASRDEPARRAAFSPAR